MPNFDVRTLLGRSWLKTAMTQWQEHSPVKNRLTLPQAAQVQRDWYYRHAHFEQISTNSVIMMYGENNPTCVLSLLRWLGPGAELLEPQPWRVLLKAELEQMPAQSD